MAHGRRRKELDGLPADFPADFFWSKAEERPSGCFVWQGRLRPDGDGVFYWRPEGQRGGRHRELSARRCAYMDGRRRRLRPRWKVISLCRTPGCVNPEHLRSTRRG